MDEDASVMLATGKVFGEGAVFARRPSRRQ
jgi:hypothetical protein